MPKLGYTTKTFQEKINEIHGKNKYTILSKYKGSHRHVKTKCNTCGHIWDVLATNLISKKGCPNCANKRISEKQRKKLSEFIRECKEIHGDIYDYSQIEYKNNKTPIKIKCKKCNNIFKQTPSNHMKGHGCPYCAGNKKYTTEEFIYLARKKHKYNFDYTETKYKNIDSKVKIKCNNCNRTFEIIAYSHLQGVGCPYCGKGTSKYELLLEEILEEKGVLVERNIRGLLINPNLELDLYLPKENIAFEFNGFPFHYSTKTFNRSPNKKFKHKHHDKTHQAFLSGIYLIHIFADTWNTKNAQIKDWVLRVSVPDELERVDVNKITFIPQSTAIKFIEKNAVFPTRSISKALGAYDYKGRLIAVMTFTRSRSKFYEWQLTNYVESLGVLPENSKDLLWQYFVNNFNPDSVYALLPAEIYPHNFLSDIGFVMLKHTKPTCFGVDNNMERHKAYKSSEIKMWDAGKWHFSWRRRDKVMKNGK